MSHTQSIPLTLGKDKQIEIQTQALIALRKENR